MDKDKLLQNIYEQSLVFGFTEEDREELINIISNKETLEKLLKDIKNEINKDKNNNK